MMNTVSAEAKEISKSFSRREVLDRINFSVTHSRVLGVIGRNGSGKSTLVKIIAGILSASRGELEISVNGESVKREEIFNHVGFVSPYLQLYDEFTASENLHLFNSLRKSRSSREVIDDLLRRVGLYHRKDDTVRTYSSGMKQRLKYAFAVLHRPPILLLDEPRTNLDSEGIALMTSIVEEQRKFGLAIIASNDKEDRNCFDEIVNLDAPSAPGSRKKGVN